MAFLNVGIIALLIGLPVSGWAQDRFENVSYQCSTPEDTADLRLLFEHSVNTGIDKLKNVNVALAAKAENALASRKLKVMCQCTSVPLFSSPPEGEYAEAISSETESSICFNFLKVTSLANWMRSPPDFKAGKNWAEYVANRLSWTDGMAFHEFMHFAHFDNLKMEIHNQLPMITNDETDRWARRHGNSPILHKCKNDIIYSCMWTLFPSLGGIGDYTPVCNRPEQNVNFCTNFKP